VAIAPVRGLAVGRAADTGDRGVVCVVERAGLELDLNDVSAL
jgi:hypothetical protein